MNTGNGKLLSMFNEIDMNSAFFTAMRNRPSKSAREIDKHTLALDRKSLPLVLEMIHLWASQG